MAECKECGNRLRDSAVKCPACGWVKPQSRTESRGYNRIIHSCAHTDRGETCAQAGSLSEGTLGGGPWYCHQHFPAFKGWNQERRAPMPRGWRASLPTSFQRIDLDAIAERVAIQGE